MDQINAFFDGFTWLHWSIGVLLILVASLALQVDRLSKAHDKLVDLLFHIPEVRDGALADHEYEKIIKNERKGLFPRRRSHLRS